MDRNALKGVSSIVHLAGVGIAERRWNQEFKQEILDSRVETANVLYDAIADMPAADRPSTIVSAAGVGVYGAITTDIIMNESSPHGKDYLAYVSEQWENAIVKMKDLNLREVRLRLGVVLSDKGGALDDLVRPVRFFVGAPLASGQQWMPFVHIDDAVDVFVRAVEDNAMHGAYNVCAPEHANNDQITRSIAKTLGRPLILPKVPEFVLYLMVGEVASVLAEGSRVAPRRLQDELQYEFKYKNIDECMQNLLQ